MEVHPILLSEYKGIDCFWRENDPIYAETFMNRCKGLSLLELYLFNRYIQRRYNMSICIHCYRTNRIAFVCVGNVNGHGISTTTYHFPPRNKEGRLLRNREKKKLKDQKPFTSFANMFLPEIEEFFNSSEDRKKLIKDYV